MGKVKKNFSQKERGLNITRLQARDGGNCQLCGEALNRHIKNENDPMFVTFDHKIPASKGELDILSNKQLAHRECNQRRGNRPLMPINEFRTRYLGLAPLPHLENGLEAV